MSSNIKTSKNGSIVWRNVPVSQVGRTSTRNVFRPLKCHVSFSRPVDSVSLAFHLIFSDRIINIIIKMTNDEGKRRQGSKWKPVHSAELKALIGLFIHLGAQKLKYKKFGASAHSEAVCTMSMKRFIEL